MTYRKNILYDCFVGIREREQRMREVLQNIELLSSSHRERREMLAVLMAHLQK